MRRRGRAGATLTAVTSAAAGVTALGLLFVSPAGAQGQVDVYPIAGDQVATRTTQIVFRGLPADRLGPITVTGSETGAHSGTVVADSDGDGASFIPSTPFDGGETVTVRTHLDVVGSSDGSWSFTVQTPAPARHDRRYKPPPVVPGSSWSYRSEPTLHPAAVQVTRHTAQASRGDLFLGPQLGTTPGVEILDGSGDLVYFHPVPRGQVAMNVDAQTYDGKPALTWWQGDVTVGGTGRGVDEIDSSSYRHLATVRAGNGLDADLHNFTLGPHDTAWITAYRPVIWDAADTPPGLSDIVLDSVAQEIDIKTGLVLFQWDSLDHVPVSDSYIPVPPAGGGRDYFHINTVQPLPNGTVLISSRNTCAVYDVSEATGQIVWSVGGRSGTYQLGPGARFWYQHDAHLQADGQLTLFDNGGVPHREPQSRGLTLDLDPQTDTATVAEQFTHTPPVSANVEGSSERLPDGDTLIGWGHGHDLATEYGAGARVDFDARFRTRNYSYRVFRQPWTGTPTATPSIAAVTLRGRLQVSVSWNGTTQTSRWRVLGGRSPARLTPLATVPRRSFETTVTLVRKVRYVEVQALSGDGQVLAHSTAVRLG